jgi:hypothetical protein
VAEALPALTYARKRLKQAGSPHRGLEAAVERVTQARAQEPPGSHHGSPELYDAVGELLLAAVDVAGDVGVDPEIALRRAVPA